LGIGLPLTGGLAPIDKAMLLTEPMCRSTRRAAWSPTELVLHNDQSNPATVLLANRTNSVSSVMPYGSAGKDKILRCFFEAAMTINPKLKNIALVGADAEFAINALEGARTHAKRLDLTIVSARSFVPSKRRIPTVLVAGYPPHSTGPCRAAGSWADSSSLR
jgi:hypothetical protein